MPPQLVLQHGLIRAFPVFARCYHPAVTPSVAPVVAIIVTAWKVHHPIPSRLVIRSWETTRVDIRIKGGNAVNRRCLIGGGWHGHVADAIGGVVVVQSLATAVLVVSPPVHGVISTVSVFSRPLAITLLSDEIDGDSGAVAFAG